jgi:hypothetical protein
MPSSDDDEEEDVAAEAFTLYSSEDSGLRFDFRLTVPPGKASTTAGQHRYEASKDLLVACGIALRALVQDLRSLAVAAFEFEIAAAQK